MLGMGIVGLVGVIAPVLLLIAALMKYLFFSRPKQ